MGMDAKGNLRAVVKNKKKVDFPKEPEHYRRRLRVEANLWKMISTKYTNKPWLQGDIQGAFDQLTEYILGEKVLELGIDK